MCLLAAFYKVKFAGNFVGNSFVYFLAHGVFGPKMINVGGKISKLLIVLW